MVASNQSAVEAANPSDATEHTGADAAARLERALAVLPDAGTTFLGFHLLSEIGRGAFSRVFLARQAELGDRNVVLKISVDLFGEPYRLAQLQHTNIVPVYSAHAAGPLEAICMPYFGRTTLADVLTAFQGRTIPENGAFLARMLRATVLRDAATQVAAPTNRPEAPLQQLEQRSYVHALLWMTGRLAAGLAHAHERGIVHRDLKPANILISDDGEPMLLDFNMSADLKQQNRVRAQLGGTMAYMAPEHLEAFLDGERPVDARSDIYSLGVLLYEALTGRLPFALPSGPASEVVPHLLTRRPTEAVDIRTWNPAVTPAVESIVRRCLAFEPEKRYQSAKDLAEDIDRHLHDLPLRHASEPSLQERARKWVRRHPRLTSRYTLISAAAIIIAAVFIREEWVGRERETAENRARVILMQAAKSFPRAAPIQADLLLLQLHFGEGIPRPQALDEDLVHCREFLGFYDVLKFPNWYTLTQVQALPPAERDILRSHIIEILFWSAQALLYQSEHTGDAARRAECLKKGRLFNERAEECFTTEPPPRAILVQKAALGRGAPEHDALAKETNAKDSLDAYVNAYNLATEQKVQQAIGVLTDLLERYPQHYGGRLLLAVCLHNLAAYGGNNDYFDRAIAAYGTCLALQPAVTAPRLQRGWLYIGNPRANDWKLAKADAKAVLDLQPGSPAALLLHARALEREVEDKCQGKPAEAITVKTQDECKRLLRDAVREVTETIQARRTDPALYFFRARLRRSLGEDKAADEDLAKVLAVEPPDAEGWAFRGRARLLGIEPLDGHRHQLMAKKTPAAALTGAERSRRLDEALKDFDHALQIDARCLTALYQKGRVLARITERIAAGLKVLERTIELYPDFTDARAERGLLLARQVELDRAYADAIACLQQDPSPRRHYQCARIYALTARKLKRDRPPALEHLSFALRNGYGWESFEHEADFAAIRDDAEFRKLVQIAPLLGRGVPPRMRSPGKDRN